MHITVTAYRFGDTFLFQGYALAIEGNEVIARIVGDLSAGEVVCMRNSANPPQDFEKHACVQHRQGDRYQFAILSLSHRQRQCLKETGDWALAMTFG